MKKMRGVGYFEWNRVDCVEITVEEKGDIADEIGWKMVSHVSSSLVVYKVISTVREWTGDTAGTFVDDFAEIAEILSK